MDDRDANLVILVELEERAVECFDRALHIRLDDDVEILDIPFLNLLEEIVERDLLRLYELRALTSLTGFRDRTRLLLFEHSEDVASLRHVIQS